MIIRIGNPELCRNCVAFGAVGDFERLFCRRAPIVHPVHVATGLNCREAVVAFENAFLRKCALAIPHAGRLAPIDSRPESGNGQCPAFPLFDLAFDPLCAVKHFCINAGQVFLAAAFSKTNDAV